MRMPTPQQQPILANQARLRVVRSAPGSGKTWLVAELIRGELDNWKEKGCGIAALSFTRVGGDEIRKALGHEIDHPHFVGTIDAFLFRYVVRLFLKKCYPWFSEPRLIPGDWGAEHWRNYGANQSATVGQGINLFSCVFIDEEEDKAVVAHKPYLTQPLQRLTGDELDSVKQRKRELWSRTGCLTHSDAALWASKILEHETYGVAVRAEVIGRFPLLIVDELQDTGYFLGKSIRLLVSEPSVRGVLVGDPDQAIFEFTGARPALFNGFEAIEGAVTLTLSNSRRCPPSVTEAARHLKDSGGEIGPAEDREGRAILIRYEDMKADVERIVRAVTRTQTIRNIKVIARSNQTVDELAGRRSKTPPKLYCPALDHIHRAVIVFRQGRQAASIAAARAALELVVFGNEGVSDETLRNYRIDPHAWSQLAARCLLSANALPVTGNVFDWQKAAGEILDAGLKAFGLDLSLGFVGGKLKPQRREGYDRPVADFLPQPGTANSPRIDVPVQTVHSVKGETHEVTIFVCPKTRPSVIWWSEKDEDREEKRIAYVAMTRTQGDLILCVSEACFQGLADCQPKFVASFECMTAEEYVAAVGESAGVSRTDTEHAREVVYAGR